MSNRPRHRRKPPRSRTLLKRFGAVAAILAVVLVTGLLIVIKQLEGNITGLDVSKDLGNRPDKLVEGPLNVLVMGDDTRKGQGPAIGGTSPGLSDTTILLHLSADRKRAYGISLPRDAMVERPECRTQNGTDAGGLTQFNAAYAVGGPACTMKTVEALTGIRLDHFVVIQFKGFREMVDAIGGVEVCVPQEINDTVGHINLPAGTYKVTGAQALDYVRVRHGIGTGSDVGRMKRQQSFIASMINQVIDAGTLANPVRLYNFLDAATKSLITDEGFSHLQPLVGLGRSLQNIGLDNIQFITVPFEEYPPDPNRLQWAPSANQLWQRIKLDKPLTAAMLGDEAVSAARKPGQGETTPSPSPSASAGTGTSDNTSGADAEARAEAARANGLCA